MTVKKLTSVVLTMLALLSLQFGSAVKTHAFTMSHSHISHHITPLSAIEHAVTTASHHSTMNGSCCVTHNGACDLIVLFEECAFSAQGKGQLASLDMTVHQLPAFIVLEFLRPPISTFV